MDRRTFSLGLMGVSAVGLPGCWPFDSDDVPVEVVPPEVVPPPPPPPAPVGPELATPTSLPASSAFLQTVTATDGDSSAAPGQANQWDLVDDFSIDDGYDDQFDDALTLSVIVGMDPAVDFPDDQVYAELTALGPEMGTADGVRLVSFSTDPQFVINGVGSAVLHPVPDAKLQQTLNLTTAVAPITLTWAGDDDADANFSGEPFYMQVVLRDAAGALLATLYRRDGVLVGVWGTANLSAFAGQSVVLSFEHRSSDDRVSNIDDVSVTDSAMTQFVTNRGFEVDGAGWTVPANPMSCNVRSGMRTVAGLQVTRSFFAQPNQLWGRMTDEFFNPTGAAIVAKVRYNTDLGSDDAGIIYDTPGASGRAITSWDGDNSDRDVGWVFGAASTKSYTSDTGLGDDNGDEDVTVDFNVSVPAGGRVTLVNFLIMTGTDTADTAVDITARATAVDVVAADIATNFRTNLIYQRGLTQQQIDTLTNF